MKHRFVSNDCEYEWDDAEGHDISIPLYADHRQANCFYAPMFEASPVVAGDFVGSTKEGGAVNFFNVRINPHGNGTHTECVGHISKNGETINQTLNSFFSIARLISIYPQMTTTGDKIITKSQLIQSFDGYIPESLIIRTLPNHQDKRFRNYSGSNPAYLSEGAMQWIVDQGIKHLLVDLPSVDREEDGGKLLAHNMFWYGGKQSRLNCTITEMIYVDNNMKDDVYLLSIQIASFELDASPSKPVIYQIEKIA